jgi:hypothetical protein
MKMLAGTPGNFPNSICMYCFMPPKTKTAQTRRILNRCLYKIGGHNPTAIATARGTSSDCDEPRRIVEDTDFYNKHEKVATIVY